eukprot:1984377-Prymnesium_polylepis.1
MRACSLRLGVVFHDAMPWGRDCGRCRRSRAAQCARVGGPRRFVRRAARRDGYPAHDEPPTHRAKGGRLPSELVHTSSARWVRRP